MEAFDDEIRRGYRTYMKPSATCVTVEDLEAFYTNRLSNSRMEEVRSHLVSCEHCLDLSREYCEFWEISPVAERAVFDEQARGPATTVYWHRYWPRPALQLAAAVLLVVSLGVIWTITRPSEQRDAIRSTAARAAPVLISPKGDLQEPPKGLEWQAVNSADHYEVEIEDAHFKVLWREPQVKDTRVSIPDGIIDTTQEASYGWRVTAVMADGRRVVSAFATFRVGKR